MYLGEYFIFIIINDLYDDFCKLQQTKNTLFIQELSDSVADLCRVLILCSDFR